ncbi:tat twin-arginine translocation pathway signal sequence domain protein [Asticcacaulis biprosthecium C19]|uniref:Tat twin-arginine translocation pathway signal sequence domain protein n=1 Tax=Asticcacaulis biprosthecium C19 TaxID=715226 RepID=F4QTI5_9CAUL|nr:right-handed parallel beta-helix repeat-containing protein [Asticcacaulis biprosthecium]EGF90055.1 tat twin-arginine translocation pathway signal sequence domain protein [Asticcacaulis biprosthecium C19]
MIIDNGRINRRRLMGYAAAGGMAALSCGAWGKAKAAQDSRLPDGTEFALWEQPLNFSKTYYVDNTSATADDNGPGDQARPFRTINQAAQVLQPGERVIIAAGDYRECVRPARGGDGPSRMISYEAAPGARVCIKGSEILTEGWRQETVHVGFRPPGSPAPTEGGVTTWRYQLDGALFPDAYNPFALPSLMGSWAWLNTATVDMGPYLRRRGLVFVDGKPLEPVEQLRELAAPALPSVPDFTKPAVPQNGLPARRRGGPIMQEIGGVPDARFWVDPSGTAIQVRLASGTPADHAIEVTTRQHAFLPMQSGLGFIRVKGLTFQHAGNAYPFPQYGMVSLAGGDHWILEGNTLEWANGLGLAIGFDGNSAGALKPGVSHVIRGNIFRYCGIGGIGGMGTTDVLIEDNLIEWCGWADAERGWEASGVKFHRARNMMFRRNIVRHMRHGNAAWWDVDNTNCRITGNIFADVQTVSAAVHMEMTRERNQIDNNIIWDVRNAEPGTAGQRGCAGSGLFINASEQLIVAQNLIGRCDNSGVFAILRPDRAGSGQARDNTIANNIFAKCVTSAIVFLDRKNAADGNVYIDMPARFQGFLEGDTKTYLDLASWRTAYGWDRTSVEAAMQVAFDPVTLRLTLSGAKALPKVALVHGIQSDLLGAPTGALRIAGPLANLSARDAWMVDPRRRTSL